MSKKHEQLVMRALRAARNALHSAQLTHEVMFEERSPVKSFGPTALDVLRGCWFGTPEQIENALILIKQATSKPKPKTWRIVLEGRKGPDELVLTCRACNLREATNWVFNEAEVDWDRWRHPTITVAKPRPKPKTKTKR
jgi:hypothetical protein